MKRRTFCTAAVAGAALMPLGRLFAAVAAVTADIAAITGDGRKILLSAADVEDFRAGLRGPLLLRGAAGYDDARKVFNGMFDRHPALIARCAGAPDVVRSVQFARAHELLVAVRGGGHSFSGQSVCDDGLMIDLSAMRNVRVDPARLLVRAGGGALLGDLDRETLPFSLVTTTGTVSHTGAGGLTLGGGFGRLSRRFGLACDQLTSADVVTADGRLVEASASENADLFWGIRGGGGNFGVATSLEYRLHPFDGRAIGGRLVFPIEQARQVLLGYAELYEEARDGMWIEPFMVALPSGARVLTLDFCCTGGAESKDDAIAPYLRLGKPIEGAVGPESYLDLQTQDDAHAKFGGRYYIKSGFVERLDRDLIDAAVEVVTASPIPHPRLVFSPMGGAADRIARDATAFWHRSARHTLILRTINDDPAEDAENVRWARSQWPVLEKFTAGYYANTTTSETPTDRVRGAYGGNYERLLALKRKYDPANLFRLNANIDPSA